jgi:hypothetical protein
MIIISVIIIISGSKTALQQKNRGHKNTFFEATLS